MRSLFGDPGPSSGSSSNVSSDGGTPGWLLSWSSFASRDWVGSQMVGVFGGTASSASSTFL